MNERDVIHPCADVREEIGDPSAALAVLRSDSDAPARRMFRYSLLYLATLFALLIVDAPVGLSG